MSDHIFGVRALQLGSFSRTDLQSSAFHKGVRGRGTEGSERCSVEVPLRVRSRRAYGLGLRLPVYFYRVSPKGPCIHMSIL